MSRNRTSKNRPLKIVNLIQLETTMGNGTQGDPYYTVVQFYSTEGVFLFELSSKEHSLVKDANGNFYPINCTDEKQ